MPKSLLRADLKKLSSLPDVRTGQHPPRTPSIVGYTYESPEIGVPFVVIGESLKEESDFRRWTTSPVQSIVKYWHDGHGEHYHFKTMNSEYSLELRVAKVVVDSSTENADLSH